MAQPPIPEDIRRFILTSIASVPHLEALLLLRAEAGQDWLSSAVAERLYIGEKVAMHLLDDLTRAGMTALAGKHDGHSIYRYAPASPALGATIDRLAELYARHLLDITHLIHSKMDRKAQQFADAFKWRKDS